MEKHDSAGGSTLTDVMTGCTETATGPLVMPAAVTVIVAVPVIGLPSVSKPLHTTKIESQTPAHTWPPGEMVAMLVSLEWNVNVVLTVLFDEFTAATESPTTSPPTMESEAGLTVTTATVLLVDFDPPQPAMNERKRTITADAANRGRRSLIPCNLRGA